MLVIRKQQMEAFAQAAAARFERRAVEHLCRFFPRQCDFLGAPQVRRAVELGIERSESYGHRSGREILLYISLMFLLGADFDQDPQLPWAAPHLRKGGAPRSFARLERLYDTAMEHLDAIHGEENQRLVRALLRFRALDPATLPGLAPDSPADAHRFLARFLPEKAARQGETATRELVALAAATAERYGLTQPRDTTMVLLHMFFVGSGFDRDPQFPWAAATLAGRAPDRVERLFRASVDFLNKVLE